MSADQARPRVSVAQFTALVTEVREVHRKLDVLLSHFNVDASPVSSRGARVSGGVRHLPGSQPFGTSSVEVSEVDPIPGAGPGTAREALRLSDSGREGVSGGS